jgi:hypothetical protein
MFSVDMQPEVPSPRAGIMSTLDLMQVHMEVISLLEPETSISVTALVLQRMVYLTK